MRLFNNIFGFDRDGKTDFTEKVVGTAMAAMMFDDAIEEERRAAAFNYTPSYSARYSAVAGTSYDDAAWHDEHRFDMSDVEPDEYDTEEE